jgi:hypothetical protein
VIVHFSRSSGRERSVTPLRYSAIPLTRPCIIVRIIVLLELVLPYSKAKMAPGTPKSRFSITDRRTDYHRDEQKKEPIKNHIGGETEERCTGSAMTRRVTTGADPWVR